MLTAKTGTSDLIVVIKGIKKEGETRKAKGLVGHD